MRVYFRCTFWLNIVLMIVLLQKIKFRMNILNKIIKYRNNFSLLTIEPYIRSGKSNFTESLLCLWLHFADLSSLFFSIVFILFLDIFQCIFFKKNNLSKAFSPFPFYNLFNLKYLIQIDLYLMS